MEIFLTIIGIIISLGSLIFGYIQIKRQQKLSEFVKSELMTVYNDSAILLGSIQYTLDALAHEDIPSAKANAGKAEGMCQSIFNRSVKNIYDQNKYSESDIDRWIKQEKILPFHRGVFMRYVLK
jgi:hypothetical protein